jgi:hypothetical protein
MKKTHTKRKINLKFNFLFLNIISKLIINLIPILTSTTKIIAASTITQHKKHSFIHSIKSNKQSNKQTVKKLNSIT